MFTLDTLRTLRKERGLSQAQLAESLGVNQTAISQWERGITTPSSRMLLQLSQIFNINPAQLLGSEDCTKDKCKWDDPELIAAVQDNLSVLLSTLETDIRGSSSEHQKKYFDILEILRHALRLPNPQDRDVSIAFLHSLLTDALHFMDSRSTNQTQPQEKSANSQ